MTAAEHNPIRDGIRTQLLTNKLGGQVCTQSQLPGLHSDSCFCFRPVAAGLSSKSSALPSMQWHENEDAYISRVNSFLIEYALACR